MYEKEEAGNHHVTENKSSLRANDTFNSSSFVQPVAEGGVRTEKKAVYENG